MGTYYDTSALINGQPQDISVIKGILDTIDAKLLELEAGVGGGGADNYIEGWAQLEMTYSHTTTGSFADVEFTSPTADFQSSDNLDFTSLTGDDINFVFDGAHAGIYRVSFGFLFNGDNSGRISVKMMKTPNGEAEELAYQNDFYAASSSYTWFSGGPKIVTFASGDSFRIQLGNFTGDTIASVDIWVTLTKLLSTVGA